MTPDSVGARPIRHPKLKGEKMVKEIKAPTHYKLEEDTTYIFLAGSIDMGKADNWQKKVVAELEINLPDRDIVILNPRRDIWDTSWVQNIDHLQFREQVDWELDALNNADIIPMVFLKGTVSPIALLELGLHITDDKLIVYCEEGYWRKGNVDIVCNNYVVSQVSSLDALVRCIVSEVLEE